MTHIATPSPPHLTRRDWMSATTAALGTLATSSPLLSKAPMPHPWIDAHSHIWTRDIANFPLASGTNLDDLAPPSFTAEELLQVAHANDVGRVVLIQHHPFHGWDNSYVIDAARRYPQAFRVVGMVDNFSDDPGGQMRRLLSQRVTGFRITPGIYQDKWLGGGMDSMWQTAAETGQAMCGLVNPSDLAELDHMCTRYPDTTLVIDHFARIGADGQIRQTEIDELKRLAKHPKTFVKISAFYALGHKRPPYHDLVPMIRQLLDAYGIERLMWASDSPYQINDRNTYHDSISAAQQLDFLSDDDRQWLLRKTAERVYFFA